MKTFLRLACVLLGLVIASSAFALESDDVISSAAPEGRYVKFNIAYRYNGIPPVPLPEPGEGIIRANSTPGPVTSIASTDNVARGGAIVGPSGGSFLTPRRMADREIQKLIRRLD